MLLCTPVSAVCLLLHAAPQPRITRSSCISASGVTSNALAVLGGALSRIEPGKNQWKKIESAPAWVLLPPSLPWACVHFVGGAGFGTAPHIAYDAMLSSLVQRLGIAVIATPYDIGTDHWRLSKSVHAAFDVAVQEVRESSGLAASAPVYRLGHSLGAKLLTLGKVGPLVLEAGEYDNAEAESASASASASAASAAADAPLGLLAFNNFDLSDSITLASDLIARVQNDGGEGSRNADTARTILDAFGMVQQVANAAGVGGTFEVSPTPSELEESIRASYSASSTAIWRFEGDGLDSSDGLVEALQAKSSPHMRESLAGSHLSPVVFRLEAKDIDPALELLLGSGRGFSFGSASAVEPLCDALCEWIWPSGMAKAPKQLVGSAEADPDGAVDVEVL